MTRMLDPVTGLFEEDTSLPRDPLPVQEVAAPEPPRVTPEPEEPTLAQDAAAIEAQFPRGLTDLLNAVPLYEDLLAHFPFPEIRQPQVRLLQAWSKAMGLGKDYVIGELPTGAGKSPLSWALGSYEASQPPISGYKAGAYLLTTQKSLQEQYMRDFAKLGMVDLKGAANYPCADHDTDCRSGGLLQKAKQPKGGPCPDCPYKEAKERFAMSTVGVTNFAYLLTEAKHIRRLPPRSLLIIDEAHNTESQILSQIEIEITTKRCALFGTPPPPPIEDGAILDARAWVLDVFLPLAKEYVKGAKQQAEEDCLPAELQRVAALEQFLGRFTEIENVENVHDWFCNVDKLTGTLKLRPLTAASYAESSLFRMGHKLLFLSATILDPQAFAKGLGLGSSRGGFCRVESDFPVENRPIHFVPAGSMSYKNKANTMPKLMRYIERVLNKHPEDKGIIHANSYALTKTIQEFLMGTKHRNRIIVPESGFDNRARALDHHHCSEEATVLISPSMTEGLDLYGDLSRFQIIPKIPYPNMSDPFVKARMDYDERWMSWQTALTIIQATGRSIRSKEDHATTYILDSDFAGFMSRAASIMPEWWKKSIIYH